MNNSPFLSKRPGKDDIISAHERVGFYAHKTPLLSSELINSILGCKLFLKCENFQKAGAFKFRGASNVVMGLSENFLNKGVATHSSGNHAGALALAAKLRGTKAYIVMPETAPKIKVKAVEAYGAEIFFCKPNQKAREDTLNEVVDKTGALFIHPYDNYSIIAGQATAAKEILEEKPELDFIFTPVGGGGLASGTCLSANYFSTKTKVIGCEPAGADDAFRSLKDGKIYPSINPQTIADGLLTSLSPKTFEILSGLLERVITVSEEEIIYIMRLIWERMKIIIEPSSAVPVAALYKERQFFKGKNVAAIISGGNVDLDNLPWNT